MKTSHANRSDRRPRRVAGFTLIELLTVIAIVGILAAIIIPTVGKVRDSARGITTLNRMRNIGTAYLIYVTENSQKLILNKPTEDQTLPTSDYNIQEAVAPYLTLSSQGSVRMIDPIWWDAHAEINGLRTQGNAENQLYYPNPPAWPGGPPRNKIKGFNFNYRVHLVDTTGVGLSRMSDVKTPSRTALILARRNDGGASNWNVWADGREYSTSNGQSMGAKRAVFYFDGHVGTQKIDPANYNASVLFTQQ